MFFFERLLSINQPPAPECPLPPEVPLEGERLYHPTSFPVTSLSQCAVNGDLTTLSCHSFLNVYPTRLTYGRNATLKKDLCDGLHAKDDKAPFRNCFDENISRQRLSSLRSDCTGLSSCSQEVPTIVLDPVCDGLRREQRVEYICGETKIELISGTEFCVQFTVLTGLLSSPLKTVSASLSSSTPGPPPPTSISWTTPTSRTF